MSGSAAPDQTIAVLTGDFIGSTRWAPRNLAAAQAALVAAADKASTVWPGRLIGRIDVFRGDSWQLAVAAPGLGLRIALFLRAGLRSAKIDSARALDTRVALGVGLAGDIDNERISRSSGAAFTASGRALDAMKREPNLAIAGDAVEPWASAMLGLVDALANRWTARQAEAVAFVLADPSLSQEALGKRLDPPVAQQTAGELLSAAGWPAIAGALHVFESQGA